jgi:hypothetical protein
MFQFPGSARAFRDRRSLGSSPGLFAAFHARILMTPRHPPRALRSLTTPIGPPRPPGGPRRRRGGLTRGPGLAGTASRDAMRAPGRSSSRSVRVRSSSAPPPIRIGEGRETVLWRVPLTLARRPAGSRRRSIARVCVNSIRAVVRKAVARRGRDLAPRGALPHDPVDSCVTNHRIVREQRADRSAPPRLAGQGAGPSLRRPRPAARGHGTNPGRLHGRPERRGEAAAGRCLRTARREPRPCPSRKRTLGGSRRGSRPPGLGDGADAASSGPARSLAATSGWCPRAGFPKFP